MTKPFDDPHYGPPADLAAEEARAYEETVLKTIREALPPGRYLAYQLESIELEGQRPETAVVFRYRKASDPQRLLTSRDRIWEDIAYEVNGKQLLDSAPSVAGHIYSAFTAGELEAREIDK